MGFVGLASFLAQRRAYREASGDLEKALTRWYAATSTNRAVSGAMVRNRPATYSERHGDSMTREGSESELLELSWSATRGIAVRDMMFVSCCFWVCLKLEHLELRAHRPKSSSLARRTSQLHIILPRN
jgi:hypothetical protein